MSTLGNGNGNGLGPEGQVELDEPDADPDHLGYSELGRHRHLVVSERLRARRRQLGLTQKEVVARLRRLGVDTTNKALSSLEHGAGLDVCKLPEIARALDCTLTYVVGLTANPLRWAPDGLTWPEPPEEPCRRPVRYEAEPIEDTPGVVEVADQGVGSAAQRPGPWILGPLAGSRRSAS